MLFSLLYFGSLLVFVLIGLFLIRKGNAFAGIMLLVFLAPIYTSILIQYINHQFPFH